MPDDAAGDVTQLLDAIRAGDGSAQDRLVQLVYDELHRDAGKLMRNERADHTLQTTALLNTAVGRLIDQDVLRKSPNRRYFFAAAGRAMRQALADHARRRDSGKRGGDYQRVTFDDIADQFSAQNIDVVDLREALEKLAMVDERASLVVTMRHYFGYRLSEVAEQLDVSIATVTADYRLARSWLHRQLGADQ